MPSKSTSRPAPELRSVAVLLAIVVTIAATLAVLGAARSAGQSRRDYSNLPTLSATPFLSPSKTDSVYDLLAPKDIRVVVGRRQESGLVLTGTSDEIDALTAFAELLGRHADVAPEIVKDHVGKLHGQWNTTRTYKMPKSKARALYRILAADDVPVLVSGGERHLTVKATAADQQTVSRVVRIMQGDRRP